jgi:hypothetical protein
MDAPKPLRDREPRAEVGCATTQETTKRDHADECNTKLAMHPREILLRDLNDLEQRILDELVALRELRAIYANSSRSEAETLVKAIGAARRVCSRY